MAMGLATRAAGEAPSGLRMDGVSIWWITFSTIWTAILIGGMVFLWTRRTLPILRIRGLPLSFGAVTLLHIYWLAVQWGYTYGHLMPAYVEFWIMGIWMPFGIALFHASNSRFLYVAQAQKRYLRTSSESLDRVGRPKTLWGRFRAMDYTNRMLLLVCTGMVFQFFLTVTMFLVSKKFHPSFGVSGTEVTGSPNDIKVESGRGWEWWPSVFWQCFWAWIVAPVILWQARDLHDSLGWRFQTIACCLSNLHAAPMWLVALYVPQMAPVNQYWIPPQWIAVSIMLLEIFTIFLPCWEVVKAQTLRQETLDSIARWEARNKAGGAGTSVDTGSSYGSWKKGRSKRAVSVKSDSNASILTMDALEHTLSKNPEPLQHFSALRDFSGENIAFLTRIAKWRTQFYPRIGADQRKSSIQPSEVNIRECFEVALRIYIDFVSSRGAEFQVNLSSTDFKKLEGVFEDAARVVYGEETTPDPATPFETANWRIGSEKTARPTNGSEDAIMSPEQQAITMDNIRYWGDIPETFDEAVFDNAETSIKYLVLTNTWPKFVKERRSLDSLAALESGL